MTSPVAITAAEEMGPRHDNSLQTQINRTALSLSAAAALAGSAVHVQMHRVDSRVFRQNTPGIPAHPKHLVAWAVRLVSPLADSACSRNRPSSQLQQGRTMLAASTVVRSLPPVG